MALIDILFTGTIIAGIAIIAFSKNALKKYGDQEGHEVLRVKHVAIVLLAIGFALHTAGDFFGTMFNSETVELVIESSAHVLLFIAFVIMIQVSQTIISTSRKYWFK